jgi:PAS domain S-box-containing protein
MTEADESINRVRELQSLLLSNDFLNTLATGYLLFDADGVVVDCNEAAERLLGVASDALMGVIWYQSGSGAVHEDGSAFPSGSQPAMITLRSGKPCPDATIGVDNPGQVRRWLLVNTYPCIVDGSLKGVVSSFVDISEHLQREHVLQLLTEVNRFVMFASDNINPLQHLCDALVADGQYVGVTARESLEGAEALYGAAIDDELDDAMLQLTGQALSGSGAIGTALKSGITQMIADLDDDSASKPLEHLAAQLGLRSLLAIPFSPSGTSAVLVVFSRNVYAFDEVTVHGLESIARESAFGISHLRSVADLASALEGTLDALSQMTESRDPYTAGHQRHVAALGAAIATRLNLGIEMIQLIREAGMVHDGGKTAIPAEFLTRPGALSALEYELVKGPHHRRFRHSVEGQAAVADRRRRAVTPRASGWFGLSQRLVWRGDHLAGTDHRRRRRRCSLRRRVRYRFHLRRVVISAEHYSRPQSHQREGYDRQDQAMPHFPALTLNQRLVARIP